MKLWGASKDDGHHIFVQHPGELLNLDNDFTCETLVTGPGSISRTVDVDSPFGHFIIDYKDKKEVVSGLRYLADFIEEALK